MRGRLRSIRLLLVLGGTAAAHSVPPEAMLAQLNADGARSAWGIERATRDAKAARLLVIRVGERWYEQPRAARAAQAAEWYARWRHGVPQGVVAILDARTDQPVVRFGPGGAVAGVNDAPAPPRATMP